MATQARLYPSAWSVLGLSPHRLMLSRRTDMCVPPSARHHAEACLLEQIDRAFQALHIHGRHSVFIVDTACGDGRVLIHAARRARVLGFVAIDARGFDPAPEQIALATAAARAVHDPAIGFAFTLLPTGSALPIEDGEIDLVIGAPDGDNERLLGDYGTLVRRS
jgi:SAM-dependent methyltransferase